VLCLSEETPLLGPPFLTFPLAYYLWYFELNTFIIVYSSSDQSTSLAKGQGPIYNLGPLSLHLVFLIVLIGGFKGKTIYEIVVKRRLVERTRYMIQAFSSGLFKEQMFL